MQQFTQAILEAVNILKRGGLVAFPTETVYGLGADASNPVAVQKIFQAKGRPPSHPLIVHLLSIEQVYEWASDVPVMALKLARAFWPGPLTMILPKQTHVLNLVTGSQDTVGLRIPRHPIAQGLLGAFGGAIAAPSANKFTCVSPTNSTAVAEELALQVDLILDGGDCEIGLESTIVDLSQDRVTILRPGMISQEAIEQVLEMPIASHPATKSVRAPGMHVLHYAPRTTTCVIGLEQIQSFLAHALLEHCPMVFLLYSDAAHALLTSIASSALSTSSRSSLQSSLLSSSLSSSSLSPSVSSSIHWVSMPADAASYAKKLYQVLRTLDKQQYRQIMIESVPNTVAWEAIRDRLSKASR